MTLKEYVLNSGDSKKIIEEYCTKAKNSIDNKENIFLRLNKNIKIDVDSSSMLKWAVIAVKDNIFQKWEISTCWSKILDNYVAPYSSTCVENLEKNWWVIIWTTNMDEFAMWSSNETSYFGPVLNPYWTNRVPGGSSGGSAVAVAKNLCMAALGTDTWWSVRQPAALCGVVWLKPTYGRISRYWVQSMASSLDQVWTITTSVDDAELFLNAIMWFDEKDSQSDERANEIVKSNKLISDYKIALPKQCFSEWLDPKIKDRILSFVKNLEWLWVKFDYVDLPVLEAWIAVYYTLMPAELSTNLSRFDWLRFWLQWNTMEFKDIHEYYQKIRSEGFWEEAKRRILLWTYVLSSSNYEWYYMKALKVREKMIHDIDCVFQNYDLILTPTTPEVAWTIWEKANDPVKMYLADMYTLPANLAWLPAISIPAWTIEDKWENMPIWLQLMWNRWKESDLFFVWKFVESIAKNISF